MRDADDNGMCHCPLCGHVGDWRGFTAGHYIKRRFLSTRWYPDNAFAICYVCNSRMEGSTPLLARYGQWIAQEIGPDRWRLLMMQRMSNEKYTQEEVNGFEGVYKNRIKFL